MRPPAVSIIVTTINTPRLTSACLKSVLKNTTVPYELIVVNNSRARAIRICLENLNGTRIIQNPRNLGYTRAANQGVLASRGKFLCFLNSDTLVPPRWLERLLDAAEKPRVGAVGPRTEPDGYRWPTQNHEIRQTISTFIDQWVERHYRNTTRNANLLTGFCLVISRTVMNRAGLFDERFFFGWEDIDYSLRLRILGYRLLTACSLFIHHRQSGSATTQRRRRLVRQSEQQFVAKWKLILRSRRSLSGTLLEEFNHRLNRTRRMQVLS